MHQDPALKTLRYWFHVEALTAPQAEDHNDRGADHFVTYIREQALPWKTLPKSPPARPYKHFVRFGIIPKDAYEQQLLSIIKATPAPDHDDNPQKDKLTFTFLGVFEVDRFGIPQPGTLQMAAFASAFSSLLRSRLIDFFKYQTKLREYFDAIATNAGENEIPADEDLIADMVERSLSLLKWDPPGLDTAPKAIVVSRATRNEENTRNLYPQIEPVNGFFLEDITGVISDVQLQSNSGLVLPYLATPREAGRIDCTQIDFIEKALRLENLPDGRWPSEFPLTLMQQVAVNQGLRSLAPGGLFSINGPPGTGKTTLLMDVIADIIVQRAKVMATFRHPSAAFRKQWEVKYNDLPNPASIFALDSRLHDFTMVVASSNNGAVENITRELPSRSKIADQYRSDASYFEKTATVLINLPPEDDEGAAPADPVEAWGLVSAALGKFKNRMDFTNTLDAKNKEKEPEPHNIYLQIDKADHVPDWRTACQEFREALARVKEIKNRIARSEHLESKLPALHEAAAGHRGTVSDCTSKLQAAKASTSQLMQDLAEREEEFQSADKGVDLLKTGTITTFLAIMPAFMPFALKAKAKVAAFEAAVKKRFQCETARNEARGALRDAKTAEAADLAQLRKARAVLAGAEKKLISASREAEQLRRNLKGLVSFGQCLASSEEDRQQILPRNCTDLSDARAQVFLKAIALHKAFILNSKDPFQKNLRRAIGMISGDPNLAPALDEAAPDLWATLSILVPVVSSTFASLQRCFQNMPRSGIGWLFIDEAGQAAPQHAVGALARAKRAFIVGDPLQVEPVVTLDRNVDIKLNERHGAALRHLSSGTSLQALVDQNNSFGTYLESHRGEPVWVGSPLKVHRRCVEPMFSISNKIAYNGTMVLGWGKAEQEAKITNGDPEKKTMPRPLLGPSRWIDVPGREGARNHFIPAQAEIVFGIVKACQTIRHREDEHAGKQGQTGLPNLFIISPFRTAAAGIKTLLKNRRREWSPYSSETELKAWLKRSVGTVHTFQGKEAETVILLLGGKSPGAVKWAASTPNILNVAVTRAQRRLYVVGDWTEWMKWPLVRGTMDIEGWRISESEGHLLIRSFHHTENPDAWIEKAATVSSG